MIFHVGDIIKWAFPDCDELQSYGIIQDKKGMYYTVFWFDDGTSNDYSVSEIRLIQRA
jgi:hypothetical protein